MDFTRVIKSQKHKKLWTDEYTPDTIEEFIGNNDLLESFYDSLKNGYNNMSSVLLVGPHGCGKTTFARLVAKKLLGEYYSSNLLELYSSINRNKNYTNNKLIIDNKNIDDFINRSNKDLKLKLIIVYDIDTTSYDTQQIFCDLLRNNCVRIIFTSNYIYTLNDQFLNNLMVFNMSCLNVNEMEKIMTRIQRDKNIKIQDDLRKIIIIFCNGDMKKLFNVMQLISGLSCINLENFYNLVDIPSYDIIKNIIILCCKKNNALVYNEMEKVLSNGYDVTDVFDIIEKTLLYIDMLEPSFDKRVQNKMLSISTQYIMFKRHNKIQLLSMLNEMISTA